MLPSCTTHFYSSLAECSPCLPGFSWAAACAARLPKIANLKTMLPALYRDKPVLVSQASK
jgi:hypothetical protein